MEEIIKKVIANIADNTSATAIHAETSLSVDLGFNSMKLLRLINDLETTFDVEYDMEEYTTENFESVTKIKSLLEQKLEMQDQ